MTTDFDLDGRVGLEELVRRIATYGQHRRIRLMPPPIEEGSAVTSLLNPTTGGQPDAAPPDAGEAAASPPVPPQSDAAAEANRPRQTRFVARPERQPQGLPAWFSARDANGDGQLSMAEFAPKPTSTTLADFARYDRDGDGVITPGEYLRAVKSSGENQPR